MEDRDGRAVHVEFAHRIGEYAGREGEFDLGIGPEGRAQQALEVAVAALRPDARLRHFAGFAREHSDSHSHLHSARTTRLYCTEGVPFPASGVTLLVR